MATTLLRCKWINFNFSFQCTSANRELHPSSGWLVGCASVCMYAINSTLWSVQHVNCRNGKFAQHIYPFWTISSCFLFSFCALVFTFDFRAKEYRFKIDEANEISNNESVERRSRSKIQVSNIDFRMETLPNLNSINKIKNKNISLAIINGIVCSLIMF